LDEKDGSFFANIRGRKSLFLFVMNLYSGQVAFDLLATSAGLFAMGWDWMQKREKRGADSE